MNQASPCSLTPLLSHRNTSFLGRDPNPPVERNVTSNSQSFDAFARQYDKATSIERRHDYFLANLPPVRDSVLDIGCGSGLLADELSRHFRSVLALDISEPMLAIAREERGAPNIEYRLCDVNDLSTGASFDAIVSHTTFHHLKNVGEVIGKLKTLLTPDGRLIFVDCVTRFPFAIRQRSAFYWSYAALQFVPDLLRDGVSAACTLFRFRIFPAWITHLKADRYFSPMEFRRIYSQLLPDAQFTELKSLMGVTWIAPNSEK